MHTDTTTASDASDLRALWCSTARRATDAQLAGCVGLAVAAALAFGLGALFDLARALRFWPILLPALLAGTFGVWGMADREMRERDGNRPPSRTLAAARWCSAAGAAIVAVLAAIGILRVTIGTWIS